MRPLELFRTATFRLAFAYLRLFAVSVLSACSASSTGARRASWPPQADETIRAEVQGLGEQYKRRLIGGLRTIIMERSARSPRSIYLLSLGDVVLAGNLAAWPQDAIVTAPGWINFNYVRADDEDKTVRPARASQIALLGGYRLLVGRDMNEVNAVESTIRTTLLWSLAITGFFGVVGGVWISRVVVRRLEVINRTSREIMSGDLTRRIPHAGQPRRTRRSRRQPE